ncbi:aldehyde dehydrogenase family protein [Desulfococcus sp.]|uniref:L-piperidine-6-carboxylate dehydrogenase n=1 Tax=Desulfococcus sp. TaxID=2025834 RepID=UPI0035945B80
MTLTDLFATLGIAQQSVGSSTGARWGRTADQGEIASISPITGKSIGSVFKASDADYEWIITEASAAFKKWRQVPAPRRGEIVRQIGLKLRRYKDPLGRLITFETGKSLQEGLGEVQEMIDIADFAVGLSRQLYGFTMHSERPDHRMYDQYHPLGVVGVITSFNFPVAVWSWNALISAVCGDVVVWKPSSKTPFAAIALQNIIAEVIRENDLPEGLFNLVIGGGAVIGERVLQDPRIPLISLTGSTRVGKRAAAIVAGRLGKSIMELGGNNAVILTENANLEAAIPAIVFGAVGTAGQRCTSTRRLIIHDAIYDRVVQTLKKAYDALKIGNPLDEANHVGPLIDRDAVQGFVAALEKVVREGGKILHGGRVLTGSGYESGCYVSPALVAAENDYGIVQEETFAPILYLIRYTGDVTHAIALHNDVPQGLASAIFTRDLSQAEIFLSARGSDCGIANVNIGTSGAEIGGAFGGEKETGGGRESGSDAWKVYMRRQTNTINYGTGLPLAQGIKFEI